MGHASDATVIVWGLLAGSAAGVLLGVVAGSVTGDMGAWLMLGTSMGASFGLTAGFIWRAVTRPSTREPCPGCGYDTHGLPRDAATGEATCPECGEVVREPSDALAVGGPRDDESNGHVDYDGRV